MKKIVMEVLKIFYDNGYEAYAVGGFVRDMILNKESFDVDITTNATPNEVSQIFKDVKLSFEQYGSVHLKYKQINFEITTYRMEFEYKNKRKPLSIIYTDKLIIDLKRRDFTMNTLCMDKEGKILDLLSVTDDINCKVIKTVGNADEKLREDSLRILRAIRFATELDFELDIELESAIINNRESLKTLSFYRKKQELNRIFSSKNVLKGIKLLKSFGLDEYLEIELPNHVVKTSDPIGIWAQVNPSSNYQFTRNEKACLNAILRVLKDEKIDNINLYKEGNYVCYIASQILGLKESNIYDRYDALPIKNRSDIKINGNDIKLLLGLKDSAKIKLIINDMEKRIINNKLKNDKKELIKYIINKYML